MTRRDAAATRQRVATPALSATAPKTASAPLAAADFLNWKAITGLMTKAITKALVILICIALLKWAVWNSFKTPALDDCVMGLLESRIDGYPDPHIPRPALTAQVINFGIYTVLVGPPGCGKTTVAKEATLNQTGVAHFTTMPGDNLVHLFFSNNPRCSRYLKMLSPPTEKHVKFVLARAAQLRKPYDSSWVPTLIIEIDRTVDTTTTRTIAQAVKRVCVDEPSTCRAVLVMSDALASFSLPEDQGRQHIVWIPDFTEAEANEYLDRRGFMNFTKAARAKIVAKVGTRAADLRKLVELVGVKQFMAAEDFVSSIIRAAEGTLTGLLHSSKAEENPWVWLVHALLSSPNGAVEIDDIPDHFSGSVLKRVQAAAEVIKTHHAVLLHPPSNSFKFYSPPYRAAAEEWSKVNPPTPPPSDTVVISLQKNVGGAPVEVEFSRRADAATIEKVILTSLDLPQTTAFKLLKLDGVVVAVDANLPPGNYTVVE